jgi:hypothetical protein
VKKAVIGISILLLASLLTGAYIMDLQSEDNSDSPQQTESPEGSLEEGTNNTTDDQETVRPEDENAPPPPPSS